MTAKNQIGTPSVLGPPPPALHPRSSALRPDFRPQSSEEPSSALPAPEIALLTGGADKPYALGLAAALARQRVGLDFIGSDEISGLEVQNTPWVNFLNLRGDQRSNVSWLHKLARVLAYYARLLRYAAVARPRVFHILWNNKFEIFDRTALMLYYRLLGREIAFTAHNVNAGKRDGNDSPLNRLTLRIQYRLADHIFVHTVRMQEELAADFGVPRDKVTIIPFGVNNTLPCTNLTSAAARKMFGLESRHKVLLFFGNIAPYKGVGELVAAFAEIARRDPDYRLIIAGRPKGCEDYWSGVQQAICRDRLEGRIIQRIEYIPDECVEQYFKAADVLVLPYRHVFQSGVLFLGFGFGLPAIATDVGSFKEDICPGETGFVSRSADPAELAGTIETYFASTLFRDLETQRPKIREDVNEKHSWTKVGAMTKHVYSQLLAE